MQNKGLKKPIMELSEKGLGYLKEFIIAKNLNVKWEENPKEAGKEEKNDDVKPVEVLKNTIIDMKVKKQF